MTAGLQLLNANGGTQIDGASYNLGLSIHQTISTTAGGVVNNLNFGYQNACVFGFNATAPLVAFNSPSVPVSLFNVGPNNSNAAGNWIATFVSESPATFDIYIFDIGSTCAPSNTHAGLQIWDATGKLLTDGALGFLNLLSQQSGSIGSPYRASWLTASYSGPSKIATIVQTTTFGVSQPGTPGNGYESYGSWTHSGGNATLTQAQMQTAGGYDNSGQSVGMRNTTWSATHIDVSNLAYVTNAGGDGGIVPSTFTLNTGTRVMW